MIDILKGLNVQAMAIDQLVDFDVPESIVMLAIYLSIPEAENTRRGRNTSDGMRRAKKMGRWPCRAPIGYINQIAPDGKHYIVPKQPDADHVQWSFQQFAKGIYSMSQVRRMAFNNGFQCGHNNFWKLLRNPIYCGIIRIPPTKTEDVQFVTAVHEPIIPKSLFDDVQVLLKGRRRQKSTRLSLAYLFPLRGYLHCPWCSRKLTGSFSQGRHAKYSYYHCATPGCKGRFKTEILHAAYENQLKSLRLIPEVNELLKLVLEDENVLTVQKKYETERKTIVSDIGKNHSLISKARRLLVNEKIEFDDFNELKIEFKQAIGSLNERLIDVDDRLDNLYGVNHPQAINASFSILQSYQNQDIGGRRHIISLFCPTTIDPFNNTLAPLKLDETLAKIIQVWPEI